MKVLSSETKALLDKLYNLRSSDSYILAEMEQEKEVAEDTKAKTAKEKEELQDKISKLTEEESVLAEQGAHLREILSGINPDDFKIVLERLNIEFDPAAIKNKVDEALPGTIEEVVKATKEAEDELVKVEEEMNSAITKIDELAVRKDTELANQEKLNEYFELALSGNINITREAITSLISQFNFTEEEQREAAKLMMFPEDALYEYDKNYQDANNSGKSISDVLIEAKESVSKPIGEIFSDIKSDNADEVVETPFVEETDKNEEEIPVISLDESNNVEPTSISDLLKSSEETDSFPFEIDKEEEKEDEPVFKKEEDDQDYFLDGIINDDFKSVEENTPDEKVEIEPIENKVEEENVSNDEEETMMDLFKRLGLSEIMFVESELNDLINLEDKAIVEKNVNILNKYGINLDIVSDNVNILSDPELDEKISKILEVGKTTDDIYFNPSVLKKYDLNGLENAIKLLEENGLDPQKVPLMAF
ncbi:MAG: hypothetical protein IKX00_01310 [Bacilli bacterium]|nr:hypothetical protein [Bacilli bacterium]